MHPESPSDMAQSSPSSSTTQGNGNAVGPTSEESSDSESSRHAARPRALPFDPTLLPKGSRSLSSIGIQSFSLGFTLAACLMLTFWLVLNEWPIWRLPTFFACLSLFHFLEYWTTARFNLPAVRASSFLLFDNGMAYNVAHSLAALEIIVSNSVPWYQSLYVNRHTITIGMLLVAVGQAVRSVAMAEAGTNFNHMPQNVRKEGHELVTVGVYAWLRHPSYFGFFWWALGTQVLVGNKICLIGYLLVLWNFFHRRIIREEKTLINFFGSDYEAYRRQTRVGIPFIG